MSITGILIAALIVGGTGLFIGVFLGVAGKKFAVRVDETEAAILEVLPGNNCGGCGYAGCAGLAAAIAQGKAMPNRCPVGGAPVAEKIAAIVGTEATESIRVTAFVKCAGTCDKTKQAYEYTGVEDCVMANMMQNNGPKGCTYGCLGFGNCVKACPFDALHIIDGVAVVDEEACKACGNCTYACPKGLIEMVPYEQKHRVQCSSRDKGKDVMSVCSVGCIGCKMCEKVCEFDAIKVVDNIAHIDAEKCTNCGKCAEKCPKKIIK
ncbi:RnfABCDGE type electron transport complex subunit B [Bariatricus massiliensis]|uniref:Ion-translocating oxidoreductase complex subunit B n=1 Tax=Bariatricus massiliensis TaxID=1745713 RepID=A0ABS8DCR5_9FIRM|nr:RnfABCDGE type electron transport complex subunit B [Bariatricus massiliensis]MCB7303806.1 RnfABCDGE type electron transport complex subunit B [Bariatricus massiliensis]MCB7373222.1 RnfABCDGE type electron transport complex subunit B [Bariatricus massiliensis]MCB7385892.1 RnfABCDGE type electron transport complex subunit B [Bariatricus massiliensis]MCB7410054.1 RnfABCDGE type electron transport complex subunit B [Bariatricus massiliensis]MCQ5252978.1 RnfABCDGE type electron transport comple